jgi:hypothetical protein
VYAKGICPHSFTICFRLFRDGRKCLNSDSGAGRLYEGDWCWDSLSGSAFAEIVFGDKETSDHLKSLLWNRSSGVVAIKLNVRSKEKVVAGKDISARVNDYTIGFDQFL